MQSLFTNYNLASDLETKRSKAGKITNERQYVVSLFKERVNEERENTGYKKLSASLYAFKLSHLNTSDLKHFYDMCDKSRSGFGKCFFGALKADN